MKNISLYIGMVVAAEDEDGGKSVRYVAGDAWHGLDEEMLVMAETAMVNEKQMIDKFDDLSLDVRKLFTTFGQMRVAEQKQKGKQGV